MISCCLSTNGYVICCKIAVDSPEENSKITKIRLLKKGNTIKPRKILIADDEYLIRWSLSQALSQQGYEVFSAENGTKAIEAIKAEPFDYIITDLLMPETDGWRVLDTARQTWPQPRVIVITAHGKEGTREMAKEKGAWAYIEKPYVLDKIKELLK